MSMTLKQKLHPRRFPGMSPFMSAIVGYIVGEVYTNPQIADMAIAENEDIVYIRHDDDCGYNHINSAAALRNNWEKLLAVAGLTPSQLKAAQSLFHIKVEKAPS